MIALLVSVIIFLLYLIYERIVLNRRIRAVPLRISITGTRGKSSVTRLLASVLREDGRKALAKTTGSQAQYVLPDGREVDISRRGITSIIEQKKLFKKAADVNAGCIIAEIMSIHPENHYIESHQLLKPHIVVITNVRRDHIDAMGKTEEEIASVLSLDIPENAKVFVPEKENRQLFKTAVKNSGGELITVQEGISSPLQHLAQKLKSQPEADLPPVEKEFSDNIDLVYALGKHLNISQKNILDGILKVKHDIGKFKIWKYRAQEAQKTHYLVNGFAANDPESTFHVISKVKEILPSASDKLTGLLSLRSDRGDRTVQWIEALKNGACDCFNRIYVTGAHSKIVKRKLKRVHILKNKQPEKIMATIMAETEDQAVIFGFGNIVGTGRLLVDYWNEIGEEYGL